jgi:queuosine precursor transporter
MGRAHVAEAPKQQLSSPSVPRTYRYYDLVMVAFVVVLICSNLIGPAKAAVVDLPGWGPFVFGAGVLFFPISYVFGDIMTEVYGYARARRIIWTGFAAMVFASIMAFVIVSLPPAPGWGNQKAYETAFGNTWRIAGASMIAFWVGEFFNSFILAKMKVATQGKKMGLRFVASTFVAEIIDSALFYPLAFYNSGIMPNELVFQLVWAQAGLKTLVEIAFLPLTYWIVNSLKRAEGEDYFDRETNFTPFSMKT